MQHSRNSRALTADLGLLIYAFVTPFVLLVGLLGNSLCIMVFRVKRLRSTPTGNSCATILSALSAVDLLVLICHITPEWIYNGIPLLLQTFSQSDDRYTLSNHATFPNHIDHSSFQMNSSENMTHRYTESSPSNNPIQFLYKPGFYQIYITITYVLRMMSVWFLVLFTIERYIGVCYPLKNRVFRSRGKVNRTIGLVVGLTLLVCSYKPILSFSVDSEYEPADIEAISRSKSMTLEASTKSTVFETNGIVLDQFVGKSFSTSENHEGAKLAFVLDSCYALLLTVVPLFLISGLSLGIVLHLYRHDKLTCKSLQSGSTSVHNSVIHAPKITQKSSCKWKWDCCGRIVRFLNTSYVTERTNERSAIFFKRTVHAHSDTLPSLAHSHSSSFQNSCGLPATSNQANFSNHSQRPVSLDYSISQQESFVLTDSEIKPSRCYQCYTLGCGRKDKKPASSPGIPNEWSVYRTRFGDQLGRQFVLTLFAISACFLLLNIPYLIVWICRWFQVRQCLYAVDSSGNITELSEKRIEPVNLADLTKSLVRALLDQAPTNNTSTKSPVSLLQYQSDWLEIALPITRTIFSFNYCVNVFLYSLVGRYFRRELARLFWGWKYAVLSRLRPQVARRMAKQQQQAFGYAQNGIRLNVRRLNHMKITIPMGQLKPCF